MKKTILLAVLAFAALTASAQSKPFSSNGFFDNWSIGLNAGAVSATHNLGFSPAYGAYQFGDRTVTDSRSFWQRARVVAGLELTKQWTPIFATALQGWADVNTTPSHTFIDRWGVNYLNKFNLSNLFFDYKGKPRFFELQAIAEALDEDAELILGYISKKGIRLQPFASYEDARYHLLKAERKLKHIRDRRFLNYTWGRYNFIIVRKDVSYDVLKYFGQWREVLAMGMGMLLHHQE